MNATGIYVTLSFVVSDIKYCEMNFKIKVILSLIRFCRLNNLLFIIDKIL
jgi:hypothetical protein